MKEILFCFIWAIMLCILRSAVYSNVTYLFPNISKKKLFIIYFIVLVIGIKALLVTYNKGALLF